VEIIHHVVFAGSDQITEDIENLGIKYEGSPPWNIGVFDIPESDQNWPRVSQLIAEKDLPDRSYTLFTEDEVLSAEWLRMNVTFEQGHPQPESKWRETTLGLDRVCGRCYLDAFQKQDFQIKKEPHLGKKDFVSLYSTAAILASSRVFEVFEWSGIRGYSKRPVLIRSTQRPSQTVSQIYVPQETEPGLIETPVLRTEICKECQRAKFNRAMNGRIQYRRDAFPTDVDFVLSHEWFGSGWIAFQEVFVSNRVARLVVEHGWKGLLLDPLELH